MKKIFLFVLFLIPAVWMMGQTQLSELSMLETDSSIVRHWTGSYNVVYSSDNLSNNQFLLWDTSSVTAWGIPLPQNVKVQDFRIMDDWLYFCGHVSLPSAQHGLLGCAYLHDFLSGGGSINWLVFLPTSMPEFIGSSCFDEVYDIRRLALYKKAASIQVAFIANNNINPYASGDSLRVGIGWAEYDGVSWSNQMIYNKHANEYYTDIITTDGYVVAVGRTNDSAYLCMRIFDKADFLIPTYGGPGLTVYHDDCGFRMSDLVLASNVVAAPVEDDTLAVAYNCKDSYVGLVVKKVVVVGGSPLPINGGAAVSDEGLHAGRRVCDKAKFYKKHMATNMISISTFAGDYNIQVIPFERAVVCEE